MLRHVAEKAVVAGVRFRKPTVDDGAAITELVRSAGTLEPNTTYAYLLLAFFFSDTCVVAEADGHPPHAGEDAGPPQCRGVDNEKEREETGTCTQSDRTSTAPSSSLLGCALGFRLPRDPSVLFLWQVEVHPSQRQRGLARALVLHLLAQVEEAPLSNASPSLPDRVRESKSNGTAGASNCVNWSNGKEPQTIRLSRLQCTIAPSNVASNRLFDGVARALQGECTKGLVQEGGNKEIRQSMPLIAREHFFLAEHFGDDQHEEELLITIQLSSK
uniref:N-acetyltransferase domain-containing protein n=1 Tax=Chromera velia CCMP2878 TaxID=1169474 RepID=A0A0G4I658_9ALVE|eukprot:Cvel_11317.t1-p1 / transcript=Cvel_11317.t1 / gene=Cvel_11317 / organism=Chromera_velia_CCMP2878 / gene_product=L-2,4-diaminobutyric acid acetyltransferase, putative / transcript_product=L-2,4-diaminobutyric acid acetyltransferase, putative / location=Cvel_scaffold707:65849-67878(-) / protein_length=272 / sequence_SO=supercontig / SO=protein_coding / is_pseudo=false